MPDAVSMSNLATWGLQSACVALSAGLAIRVLPLPSAELRYAVWRTALLACFVVPLLPGGWRRLEVAGGDVAALVLSPGPFDVAAVPPPAIPWPSLAWGAIGLVVALRAAWLIAGMSRLRSLRRRGSAADTPEFADAQWALGTRAEIRYAAGLAQPVTFGLRRPVVLLPLSVADGPASVRRAVTTHELLHVQRHDWGWVLFEEALRTVCWCNPAVWWLTSRVQHAREEVVDHLTVLAIGSRREYIEALLAFADAHAPVAAPAFARRAQLFVRIMRISSDAPL